MLTHPHWGYIYNPSKPPFDKGGFGGHESTLTLHKSQKSPSQEGDLGGG